MTKPHYELLERQYQHLRSQMDFALYQIVMHHGVCNQADQYFRLLVSDEVLITDPIRFGRVSVSRVLATKDGNVMLEYVTDGNNRYLSPTGDIKVNDLLRVLESVDR